MIFKTTKKEIYSQIGKKWVFGVDFCELQFLLRYTSPKAYTTGCKVYEIGETYATNGTIITMGYKSFGRRIDNKLINKYERLAEKCCYRKMDLNKKEKITNFLLKRFVKQIEK